MTAAGNRVVVARVQNIVICCALEQRLDSVVLELEGIAGQIVDLNPLRMHVQFGCTVKHVLR